MAGEMRECGLLFRRQGLAPIPSSPPQTLITSRRCGTKMPRAKYVQIIALCLTLVTELSDWRWLQDNFGPDPDLYELNNSQVFPTALLVRARMQQRIEAPPAICAIPPTLLVGFARPVHFIIEGPADSPIAQFSDHDPVYGFMSLTC